MENQSVFLNEKPIEENTVPAGNKSLIAALVIEGCGILGIGYVITVFLIAGFTAYLDILPGFVIMYTVLGEILKIAVMATQVVALIMLLNHRKKYTFDVIDKVGFIMSIAGTAVVGIILLAEIPWLLISGTLIGFPILG